MDQSKLREELTALSAGEFLFDEPLAPYTTIRIGGPAEVLFFPMGLEPMQKLMLWERGRKLPLCILGKGSNTLIRDGGIRGVVISLTKGFKKFAIEKTNGQFSWLSAQAGVSTAQLVRFAAVNALEGLERLAGIPGTVGGNIVMNAGTYMGEVEELIESVEILDAKGKPRIVGHDELKFSYRHTKLPAGSVVVGCTLKLRQGDEQTIERKIRDFFEKRGLAQPVGEPSLGSIFKNPPRARAKELISDCGLAGVRVGGARISERHPNFIVNEGSASSKDVLVLIRMIKEKVKEMTGVSLETEIKVVGEES